MADCGLADAPSSALTGSPADRACADSTTRRRPDRQSAIFASLWLLAACGTQAVADPRARQILEHGPVRVVVEPRRPGMTILYDGVAVSTGSELVATTPPWTPHFYVGPTPEAVAGAERESLPGGAVRLKFTHRGERDAFLATESLTLHPDGRLEQLLEARFTEAQGAALVQWRVGSLSAAVFAGCEYEVHDSAGASVARGVTPLTPAEEAAPEATVARSFAAITMQSRIGPVRIETDAPRPLVIYDYRRSKWADGRDPFFWFGDLGTKLTPGESIRYAITWHFPPRPSDGEAPKPRRVRPKVTRVADALSLVHEPEAPIAVFPTPKSIELDAGYVLLPADAPTGSEVPAIAAAAQRELAERWSALRRPGRGARADLFADAAACGRVRFVAVEAGDSWDFPAEGYELLVSAKELVLRAADEAGHRHATRTLVQLAIPLADGRLAVRRVRIRDWPALPFRGVHFFTGGGGPGIHERLLRDVVAMLKLNHAVIEAEYVRWDGHENIHHPRYGMSKADAARVVAACRRYGIEPIPLVQSLGHCQWMFENDANLELAEDPEAKWAYCVTNPKTYDFIFDVYRQAIDLFQPKYFHIGHDEFTARGRVPFRESSQGLTADELFMTDTLRLHRWLADRGLVTMMWGDLLLGPGEAPDACHASSVESARALRERLPRDIVITDWHYAVAQPAAFTSLRTFREAGLATIAATWDRPGNITAFARAAAAQQSRGLLQTTWAGHSLDPESFARERRQYEAWALAAEAAWNADREIRTSPHQAAWRFQELWQGPSPIDAPRAGFVIDLADASNAAIGGRNERLMRGLARGEQPMTPPQFATFAGATVARFDLPRGEQVPALVLAGRLARDPRVPPAVTFELALTAGEIHLLTAATAAAPAGTPIARLTAEYAEGTPVTLDLLYGEHLAAYDDFAPCPSAPVAVDRSDDPDRPYVLRGTILHLPRDRGPLRALRIESLDAAPSLVVLGILAAD